MENLKLNISHSEESFSRCLGISKWRKDEIVLFVINKIIETGKNDEVTEKIPGFVKNLEEFAFACYVLGAAVVYCEGSIDVAKKIRDEEIIKFN